LDERFLSAFPNGLFDGVGAHAQLLARQRSCSSAVMKKLVYGKTCDRSRVINAVRACMAWHEIRL
jgi:hypothetical protein